MAKKDLLVVVDYQKDFVDGALGFSGAEKIDSGIRKLTEDFLNKEDGIVICTFDTHNEKYLMTQEGRKLPVPHCVRATEGWELYGETRKFVAGLYDGLVPLDGGKLGDCVIETDTSDILGDIDKLFFVEKPAFPSLQFGNFLKKLDNKYGVNSITFVGLVTNMCVMGNAIVAKAACPEAEIIIKKDLVDSFDKDLHLKALDVMTSMQMTVE